MTSFKQVIEVTQPLTDSMKSIQNAIMVAMNTCLVEIKKAVPHIDAAQTLTLENGIFHAFDYAIKQQLGLNASDWHSQRVLI
jgi:hypothetical protein